MLIFQFLKKRSSLNCANSFKFTLKQFSRSPTYSPPQFYYSSDKKKFKKEVDEGDDEEILKFNFKEEGLGNLQNQILLKDYERIMQNESDLMLESDYTKIYIKQDLRASSQLHTLGLVESRDPETDCEVKVINIDSKLLNEYFDEAMVLLNEGQYNERSLELLFKCVINDCDGFCVEKGVFRHIGIIYSKLQESEKAIRFYHKQLEGEKSRRIGNNKGKEMQQNIYDTLILLSQEYCQIQKYTQVCSLYDLSLKIKFDQKICLHYASILFHKKNDYIGAIKQYEKVYQQHPDFIRKFDQVYDYFTCLIILRKYLIILNCLEGQIDVSKYYFHENLFQQQKICQEDIIKDWRLLFIFRLAFMHIKKTFNYYACFMVQTLQEVVQIDFMINHLKNLNEQPQLSRLKQDQNKNYSYQLLINHIEILQTIEDCTRLVKNKALQDEINGLPKIDISQFQDKVKQMSDKEIISHLEESILYKRKGDFALTIKRQDLYTALFPYVKQMLRFLFSHFHKNGNLEVAEYFILQEFKINKSDLSTLTICKKLYQKDNLKLYTGLLIEFYEANNNELLIDATELLLEIYSNCVKLGLFEIAAKYLNTCLISKQNSLNLETKRSLIVQAAYLYYYLGEKEQFISYYNQIKNINRYPQLKIFCNMQIENYEEVRQIVETNFVNRKNNLVTNNLIFYEYYIISIIKLGLFQNLDIVIKKFNNESSSLKDKSINFILYSKLLFAHKQYKYVISFLNLAMENSETSLGHQGSDNLCQINFYLALSCFFLKQYDQALRHVENFITLYNAKYPNISAQLQHLEKYIIICQIIINVKKQQISVAQSLLEQHNRKLSIVTGKNLNVESVLTTIAELEYGMLKQSIDDFNLLEEELQSYKKQLTKLVSLSIIE